MEANEVKTETKVVSISKLLEIISGETYSTKANNHQMNNMLANDGSWNIDESQISSTQSSTVADQNGLNGLNRGRSSDRTKQSEMQIQRQIEYQKKDNAYNNNNNANNSDNTNNTDNNSSNSIIGCSNNSVNIRQKPICYDFKKGSCRRRFCRYPHVMSADQVVFCHDFQNTGCFRSACRFIHRSVEDEDFYRQYGSFPLLPERLANGNCINGNPMPSPHLQPHQLPPNQQKTYYPTQFNDERNVTNVQQPNPMQKNFQTNGISVPPLSQQSPMPIQVSPNFRRRSYNMMDNSMENGNNPQNMNKRAHLDDGTPYPNAANKVVQRSQAQYDGPAVATGNIITNQPPTSVVIGEDIINLYRLYEEHNLLRRRVEINEERLHELRATNTYLLHQNEQFRRQAQCSCTSTIVNPVTLTTTTQPQPAQQQVLNAVSIAPVQVQATPIVSIASIGQPQTQIIANSTSLPSLAITANTSQGQQLAQQAAAHASQILGTSQITITPAPSMGITMNTSQPLSMSANATQPIISYPVMTHSILPH